MPRYVAMTALPETLRPAEPWVPHATGSSRSFAALTLPRDHDAAVRLYRPVRATGSLASAHSGNPSSSRAALMPFLVSARTASSA